MLSNNILTESKTARTSVVCKYSEIEANGILDKAKALVLASYKGVGYATVEQIAEYYEVSFETIKSLYQRNKEEFDNEVIKLTGKELEFVRDSLHLTNILSSKARSILLWTPKSVLRVGLLLTESQVAQAVRDVVLSLALSTEQMQAEIIELKSALNEALNLNDKYKSVIEEVLPRIEAIEQKQQQQQSKPNTRDPNFIPPGWDEDVWRQLPEQDKQHFRRIYLKRGFNPGEDKLLPGANNNYQHSKENQDIVNSFIIPEEKEQLDALKAKLLQIYLDS